MCTLRVPLSSQTFFGRIVWIYGCLVLGRDLADVITHKMALHIGVRSLFLWQQVKNSTECACFSITLRTVCRRKNSMPELVLCAVTSCWYQRERKLLLKKLTGLVADISKFVLSTDMYVSPVVLSRFHEFCLRGWCIVGKKEVCPYCKERFSMKTVYQNPWDRPHVLLGQYLDVLRYMLAWQPLILYSDQIIYNVLGLSWQGPHFRSNVLF